MRSKSSPWPVQNGSRSKVQLIDRIEKRRFVGREFLLWLWFRSELSEATLSTAEHGAFGLWIERQLVLSEAKESTRIKGPLPGSGREAKEALLRGQLPESAGLRVVLRDEETSFSFKAEMMAIGGLRLPSVLDKGEQEPPTALMKELLGPPKARKGKKAEEPDASHEVFYERMRLTQEFEDLLETLFRDFLILRLSESWNGQFVPMLRTWAEGRPLAEEDYVALTAPRKKKRSS